MVTKAPHVVVQPRDDGGYDWHTSDGWASGSVYHSDRGGWTWRHDDGYGDTAHQPSVEPLHRWPHEALQAGLNSFRRDVWSEHFDVAWRAEWEPAADALTADDRDALRGAVIGNGWASLRAIIAREANRAALERMSPAQLAAQRAREHAEEIAAILRGA